MVHFIKSEQEIDGRSLFAKRSSLAMLYSFFYLCVCLAIYHKNRIQQATIDDDEIDSVEGHASRSDERYLSFK
jgi:hypothetical protein